MNRESTLLLIKSMTMNEKRHFKLSFSKNKIGPQSKYLLLFDLIHTNLNINESFLKKKLSVFNYSTKNISFDINYLNKIILKDLNTFHSEKSTDLRVKENLKSIEILFYKGLYKECLELIKKTKKINSKCNNHFLLLDLLNWEKKCTGYSLGFSKAQLINDTIYDQFQSINENRIITDLYYQSYFLKNNFNKTSSDDINNKFKKLIKQDLSLINITESSSIESQIFYNLIHANYYSVSKKKEKELMYLEKTIDIFNSSPTYKKEKPLDFISIYKRIIDHHKKGLESIFYEKIKKLRQFADIIDLQKSVALERIFFHTYKAELDFLINNSDIVSAKKIMQEIILVQKTNKYNIEPYYSIGLNYKFACIYICNNDFSDSLKHVNLILNEYDYKDRPATFTKTEILNILIHFRNENFNLVIQNIERFNKKFKPKFKLSQVEKVLLKNIYTFSKEPYKINKIIFFKSIKNELELKKNINLGLTNKVYLMYMYNIINTPNPNEVI